MFLLGASNVQDICRTLCYHFGVFNFVECQTDNMMADLTAASRSHEMSVCCVCVNVETLYFSFNGNYSIAVNIAAANLHLTKMKEVVDGVGGDVKAYPILIFRHEFIALVLCLYLICILTLGFIATPAVSVKGYTLPTKRVFFIF